MPSTQNFVFTAEDTRQCVEVTVEDDSAVEYSEVFSLVLNTVEDRVMFDLKMADITIIDDDSKCKTIHP